MDNYKPEELQQAIIDVCSKKIPLNKIKNIYYPSEDGKKQSLKDLDEYIEKNKIDLNKNLLKRLINKYDKTQDLEILKRPIFKLIMKLNSLKYKYNTPKNTKQLIDNQRGIYSEILHN